jgi:15-cis-phytoene synthase
MANTDMRAQTKKDIMKGSKSFSMASLFFDNQRRLASWQLYSWCRYCDDQVDHAPVTVISTVVEDLRKKTSAAFSGVTNLEHPWPAFQEVIQNYQIPEVYTLDLIDGFQRDALKTPIQNEVDLMHYCYGVASSVGLMMCHIMTVSSSKALPHAVALGRAMQLTNIARDIVEDHKLGRLYLPITWLSDVGLDSKNYLDEANRTKLKVVIRRLLTSAENQYKIGYEGLSYLPTRSAWAVASALYIYRAIGHKINSDIDLSLKKRTVVSQAGKLIYVLFAIRDVSLIFLKRMSKPYTPTRQIELWRNS